jgi:signal transduction histidine kinase
LRFALPIMTDTPRDTLLIAELYDVQPQAIFWMQPVFADDNQTITDFRYTYANDEGLKFMDLSREQVNGLLLSSSPTVTDELRSSIFNEMLAIYQTGEKSETNLYNPALNKYARVLRTKLRNGILNVVQDITEETRIIRKLEEQTKQLEEQTRQLRAQKTLLDNILENSSNGISVSEVFRDDTGKVVDALTILANDAAVKFIGFPKEIYLGKRATEIEPAVMDSPYYQQCINTLETAEPFMMQYQMQSTGRWLELTVSKMDYNHLIQIFTDVTPIKEVQLQLEKAANTLRSVFDSALTSMFTFVPEYNEQDEVIDFRFGIVNAAFSSYVNETPAALEGDLGSKWFPGYMRNGVFDMYKHTFVTGETQRRETHYHVDEHDIYLDLQSVKIDHQVLVSFTDHTFLRKSQLQLEQTVKALERSNTNLEDFAHAASHDLKEPLRKILVFTSRVRAALEQRMTQGELELFERIERSTHRMQLLVDDLLEFSHVSELPRTLEVVDLNEKVKKVLSDLELPIEEKQAQIVVKDELPLIAGNRRQLQQLFHNLISNALKYSKPNVAPQVEISYTLVKASDIPIEGVSNLGDKAFHLLEVTDNGIGFEQQYAKKIFEMFQRLHGKMEYSGTGVGLSIARKVVENHNGYVWAESELGEGSSFKILLPVAE